VPRHKNFITYELMLIIRYESRKIISIWMPLIYISETTGWFKSPWWTCKNTSVCVTCTLRHQRRVCAWGLLNHFPRPTLVLTDAQGLLNHSVYSVYNVPFNLVCMLITYFLRSILIVLYNLLPSCLSFMKSLINLFIPHACYVCGPS
jgi:hypothetical protein